MAALVERQADALGRLAADMLAIHKIADANDKSEAMRAIADIASSAIVARAAIMAGMIYWRKGEPVPPEIAAYVED